MKKVGLSVLAGLFAAGLAQTATAQAVPWSDNFDSYPLNSFLPDPLINSGWEEWDGNTLNSQTKIKDLATGAIARSLPHSAWIRGSSDTIYQFNGTGPGGEGPYTSGQWSLGGWIYKPTTTTNFTMAIQTWFLIQNQYMHNGGAFVNWSVQMTMSPLTGNWVSDTATTNTTGPCIFDQWVEVRADMDLDADTVEVFYNGLSTGPAFPHNGGVSGFGSGSTAIGALDLYADGAGNPGSRVYWDDMFLSGAGGCSSNAINYCTSGTSANGCNATIGSSGTASANSGSGFTVTVSNMEGAKDGLFFYGQNGQQASSWGNGTSFQCVVPGVKRGGLQTGTGTSGACDGSFSQDLNARWCAACTHPNHQPVAGQKMQIQCWYRDPFNTSNQTTSLSDALEVDMCP
jgi:hypothetical protein